MKYQKYGYVLLLVFQYLSLFYKQYAVFVMRIFEAEFDLNFLLRIFTYLRLL
jgi:hypothetical protein